MSAHSRLDPTRWDRRGDVLLRRLRRICIAIAVACLILLPFSLGLLVPPDLKGMPVLGAFVPAKRVPNSPPQTTTPTPASTSVPTTTAGPLTGRSVVVHNTPRTAIFGQLEHFSVHIVGRPFVVVTYILHFPDGHEVHSPVKADGKGDSSKSFWLGGYTPRTFRETALIGVEDQHGQLLAATHFAIQMHA